MSNCVTDNKFLSIVSATFYFTFYDCVIFLDIRSTRFFIRRRGPKSTKKNRWNDDWKLSSFLQKPTIITVRYNISFQTIKLGF